MNARQITNVLSKAGFDTQKSLTIERDEVTVCVGYQEIDNNGHKFGTCDETKTNRLAKAVSKALGWGNGFRTGYGAWVVTAYPVNIDMENRL
jgi:hypothetical protein